ncbi:response regulator [Novosphingobium sp.]|jgi:CheY-like chemotaxis protein|uniref:response regulator n=1 Tax=Novosphingobium sp. TaxID=1874826 RepID=UPI0031DA0ECD
MAADAKNPRRILVVDDEWLLATWLAEALEDVGYLVQTASDGQEALAHVSTFRPDLVITDFMMPRLTGLELATALRALPDLGNTPIILVSGAQGAIGRGRPDLFEAVFEKPYEIDALLVEVSRLCPNCGSA